MNESNSETTVSPASPDVNSLQSSFGFCEFLALSPDGLLVVRDNRVVLVNAEGQRLFGAKNPNELLERQPSDLFPPEYRDHLQELWKTVCQQRKTAPWFSTSICRLNGELLHVESTACLITAPDGTTATVVVLRDTSLPLRADIARERSEIQVSNILDTAIDGIVSIDAQQRIILFNAAAEAIFGWRAEQMLGQKIDILIPARFRNGHQHHVEQFSAGAVQKRQMGKERTVMALRASGEEFPIEASISRTTVGVERISTVILRDVTEAVRYRQQIEEQSQILDQVTEAVSVVDPQGRITFWNRGAERLFGWNAGEVLGKSADSLLRWEASLPSSTAIKTEKNQSWVQDLTKLTKTGTEIEVEHRRTELQNTTGQLRGYLCIDIDLTERKKRERLSRRSQRLESLGTLAGGIAHDLNNLLTPILMGAKLLASGRAPANRQGLLDTMVASALRGSNLIKQLLSFAGGIRGERSPVQIGQIIGETADLLEHTLSKSVEIRRLVAPDCPLVVGDATELSQVLMNLCINSRDAMPEGGILTIEATSILLNGNSRELHPDARAGRYVLIKVTDTGEGMSTDVLDRIFDPFFTTKDLAKGTGLGLAAVQGIVKSHGGFINVYSEPGRGSRFSVFLPAVQVAPADAETAPLQWEQGNERTILLVDDEPFILQMTSTALESNGYRVLTAGDGVAAIASYQQNAASISVVLLDLMMPGLNGLQTLEELRRINPAVVVIACSGLWTTQRETEVLAHGAFIFLAKPYSDDQLLMSITRALKIRANQASKPGRGP